MTMIEDRPRVEYGSDPNRDRGGWLAEHRWEMDRGESAWLEELARFDLDHGWLADGQLSGVDWLMWRTCMARATAYEKLRIAHELRRRPLVREAFAEGRLSYSATRVITRIDWPDPGVDAALIDLAIAGTIRDLETAVRIYQRHQDQYRPPSDIYERRGLRIRPGLDGTSIVEMVLETTEAEELAAALQAFIDLSAMQPVDESPMGDNAAEPVDESPVGDNRGSGEATAGPAQRADAFMDLIRTGLAHTGEGQAAGADRYLVHLVQRAGSDPELLDGTPLDIASTGRIGCDSSWVTHLVGDNDEPLALGRRTRDWSTGQRRAIAVRDHGRCRFPGCHHRYVDIHHLHWWSRGGATDIDNGLLICPRHHTLLHHGFSAAGDANDTVTFHRPNGSILGASAPHAG